MEKEFVPYQLAVKLKALDYPQNEYFNWYDGKGKLQYDREYDEYDFSEDCCSAPTFSQAFRWLRDKGYKFNIVCDAPLENGLYYYDNWYKGQFLHETDYMYGTYEEAEIACLTKLIEIVESKSE